MYLATYFFLRKQSSFMLEVGVYDAPRRSEVCDQKDFLNKCFLLIKAVFNWLKMQKKL